MVIQIYKIRSEIAPPLPKFGGRKTSKFRRDFGKCIANISGTQQDEFHKLRRVEFDFEFRVTRSSCGRNFLWRNLPADFEHYIYALKWRPNPDPNPNRIPNRTSLHRVESRLTWRKSSITRSSTRNSILNVFEPSNKTSSIRKRR